MRTFYTGNDIEDLAASGVKQLEIGSGVALTDMARERAEELGIALVIAGSAPARKAVVPAAAEKAATLPALVPYPSKPHLTPLPTAAHRWLLSPQYHFPCRRFACFIPLTLSAQGVPQSL